MSCMFVVASKGVSAKKVLQNLHFFSAAATEVNLALFQITVMLEILKKLEIASHVQLHVDTVNANFP